MVNTYVGVHAIATGMCNPDLHCHSCNKDEDVPPGGAFAVCPECFHVYAHPDDLKKAYLQRSWDIFKIEMKGPKGGIKLHQEDGPPIFLPFTPPRFARLISCWFIIRSLFRNPADIDFCQECLHDF